MAFRDIVPWNRRRKEGATSPFELMRETVEPMERFFEKPWTALGRFPRMPEVNFEEKPSEIVVSARLPGLKREDVKIDVTEETLTIRVEQARSQEQRKHGVLRRSESSQSFVRRFALPSPIKTGEVKAAFKDEVLEIHLPRVKETQVRRIEIE
ncbi:MAG TPA: Hsp20/alpha crystallin family protein [Elusimicrobiota bacterium]|nr:Hsp20/alpha crystallin family protein [Elusimicrobiota bacterium]